MENVFKQQPKYMDDVRSSVATMINVLKTLREKCGVGADATSGAAPLPRSGGGSGGSSAAASSRPRSPLQRLVDDMTEAEVKDVILYVADIAFSLHAFLDCFDAAAAPLFEADFHLELPAFYEGDFLKICVCVCEDARAYDHVHMRASVLARCAGNHVKENFIIFEF